MKIGILQTAYKKAEDYGKFYNVQELGLARALAANGQEVILYKAVDGESREYKEECGNLTVKLVGVKFLGINGLFDVNVLDSSLDALIYFSDTQMVVPKIFKWCVKNKVAFYPYVGVMESHSESGIKREIMQFFIKRNLKVYKKCSLFVKTPEIGEYFKRMGCRNLKLLSVGLDETVMNCDDVIQNESGLSECFNLLFIGRMEEEKHPLEMLTIYEKLISGGDSYSLTMIGDGYMFDEVYTAAVILRKKYDLPAERLNVIRKVPYEEMHKYYRNADIYINLNRVEILGMSILESMYYKCPVIAVKAPGPKYILRDEYGIIAQDADDILEKIRKVSENYTDYEDMTENAYQHVKSEFTWEAISGKILREIQGR